MIVEAWDEYRGWAKRARTLQEEADNWNRASMIAFVATGVLAALATYSGTAEGSAAFGGSERLLACAAAVTSALSLYIARQALAVGSEAGWLKARATAEAIKSECFRFAAGLGPYATDKSTPVEALGAFIDRRNAIVARAVGDSLTPLDDPVGSVADSRCPQIPMTDAWYIEHRVNGQIDFYRNGRDKNERANLELRNGAFLVGILTTIVSTAAAAFGPSLSFWVAAFTTLGAALATYGFADRKKYLAASYAAMKVNIERLKERYRAGGMTLQILVATAEDLMESEHAAWLDQMTKTIAAAEAQTARGEGDGQARDRPAANAQSGNGQEPPAAQISAPDAPAQRAG